MALNITLAGTILDSGGTPIDAKVQVLAFNSNNTLKKWSDIRLTEDKDYNINLGDPDLSSQDNNLGLADSSGEFALIAVWIGSEDRLTPASEFAFIVQELSGKEVYIQNIQLRAPDPITCANWVLPEVINVGDNLIAQNNNTNELTYEAQDCTHYLYKAYFNETIFDYMGVSFEEFDFGLGYSPSNVFEVTLSGDLIVKIKVVDYFGNESICEKTSKAYNVVYNCFDTGPENISTNTTMYVTECVTGHIDKIINIKYIINSEILEGYDVEKLIEEFGSISVTQLVTYFDGYEDKTIELTKIISMENIPPEIDLEVIEPETGLLYEFIHNGTDIDGEITEVKWEIWRNNPDSDGNANWSLYYSTGKLTNLDNWSYDFDSILGEFKVIATVYDNLDSSAYQEYIISNECLTLPEISFDNIDWTKKIRTIDIDSKVIPHIWKQEIIRYNWDIRTVRIPWSTIPKRIEFFQLKKGIKFNYKIHTNI